MRSPARHVYPNKTDQPRRHDLHLFVYPVALGKGEKLFADSVDATKLTLKAHDVYANGVVHLDYGPAQS